MARVAVLVLELVERVPEAGWRRAIRILCLATMFSGLRTFQNAGSIRSEWYPFRSACPDRLCQQDWIV